jgi:hypothetical protein
MIEADEDWDRIIHKETIFGREKRLSASVLAFKA